MIVKPHWDESQMNIIRSTICKNCSDEEISLFAYVCQRTQLDPFARQIYAVKRGNNMTIQTGIDGYRLIAERTNKYSPGKEPSFEYDKNGKILKATAYVKKQTADGTWHDVSASAYWAEYVQEYNGKPSTFWGKLPHLMISKVAEALVLRKAFPADLSGLYTEDEMAQADVKPIDITLPEETKQPVKPEEPPAPETASRKDVERLLELVKQTPEERQLNFFKVIADKGWSDPYKMSAKFCSFQISSAQLMVAKAKQEVSNEA